MAICSSSASSEEHWKSVPQRPTEAPTAQASAFDQALRATRWVVSISSKPRPTAMAASAASWRGSSLALVTWRLVARRAAGAHLGVGEGDLEGGEVADDFGEAGRGKAVGEADELGARHGHVDEAAGEVERRDRHGLRRDGGVDVVVRDEAVDHVEVVRARCRPSWRCGRPRSRRRGRVVRALHRAEAVVGVLAGELVEAQRAGVPVREALPAVGGHGAWPVGGRRRTSRRRAHACDPRVARSVPPLRRRVARWHGRRGVRPGHVRLRKSARACLAGASETRLPRGRQARAIVDGQIREGQRRRCAPGGRGTGSMRSRLRHSSVRPRRRRRPRPARRRIRAAPMVAIEPSAGTIGV